MGPPCRFKNYRVELCTGRTRTGFTSTRGFMSPTALIATKAEVLTGRPPAMQVNGSGHSRVSPRHRAPLSTRQHPAGTAFHRRRRSHFVVRPRLRHSRSYMKVRKLRQRHFGGCVRRPRVCHCRKVSSQIEVSAFQSEAVYASGDYLEVLVMPNARKSHEGGGWRIPWRKPTG
jgi:hypothetical protein